MSEVVPGSPAEKAGVKRGDVIVACDKKEIEDSHELAAFVATLPVGKQVPLGVVRDGKEITLKRQDRRPQGPGDAAGKAGEEVSQGKWGLQLQDLSPEAAA